MKNQASTNTMRRLANVVILAVALPLVALVPVFIASILLPPSPSDSATGELNVSSNEANTPEIVLETVMTSDSGPIDLTGVFDSDLDPNCSFDLVLDAHDNPHSETFTGHIKVSEEDAAKLTNCSLYWTDATDE